MTKGKDITPDKVRTLVNSADRCWDAILGCDLTRFAEAYRDSFDAQVAMFPAMIQGCVQSAIDKWSTAEGVLAWKLTGAGGGGYLVLVVDDAGRFAMYHGEGIRLTAHR